MHYWITLFAFFAVSCGIHGQQGPCEIALNGGWGQCKSIFKCQPLLSIVNKANKTLQDKNLLKRSHCGIDDDAPAVCCPEQNESPQCSTPEGKIGQCINIYSCPSLRNLLKPPVSDAKLQFVQNSKCKGGQYSVCCGPIPNFDIVLKKKCNLSAFPPDPRTECCGVDVSFRNKIYGGNATAIDQYPWLTMIEYIKFGTQKVHGSGALISGLYVLTIATVVVTESLGKPVNIVLGEYDDSIEGPDCIAVEGDGEDCTDGTIRIQIEKTIPHPQYDAKKRINDIALIRMTRMAPYTDFIRPICLPTTDVTQRTDLFYLTAAGWGATSPTLHKNNIKLHIHLPHVNRNECQNAYTQMGLKVTLGTGHLCAGGEKGKDTCQGDSALMYKNGMTYEYTGIVSFGANPCGQKGIPTVYTNIYAYSSWIRSTIVA